MAIKITVETDNPSVLSSVISDIRFSIVEGDGFMAERDLSQIRINGQPLQ